MKNKITLFGHEFDDYNFPFDNSKDKCEEIVKALEKKIRIVSTYDKNSKQMKISNYIGDYFHNEILFDREAGYIEKLVKYEHNTIERVINCHIYFKNLWPIIKNVVVNNCKDLNIQCDIDEYYLEDKIIVKDIPIFGYLKFEAIYFEDDAFIFDITHKYGELCEVEDFKIKFPKDTVDIKQYLENKLDEIIYNNYFIYLLP